MVWLIVLGCLAMLVGSVSLLRPSPRERRQARLREEARELGLRVRLRKLHVPGEAEPAALALYGLPRSDAEMETYRARPTGCLIVRASNGGLDAIDDHWQFLEADPAARQLAPALQELLESLDPEILGLQCSPGGVALYWTERGEGVRVSEIRQILSQLMALTRV